MATKIKPEFPSSPQNDESGGEDEEIENQEEEEEEEVETKPNNVADILKRLQSSGALIKKPKQEFHCYTCDEDFPNWEELENHLITHVSLPSIILEKLPSDDEDIPSDVDWSDEEEETPPQPTQTTPKKIDVSQLLNKSGLTINRNPNPNAALDKLSGLGFTIKKNTTPIKTETPESGAQTKNDVMQKLGQLGGIKLKLKSDGNDGGSFKVVNGLKDFQASDDEDDVNDRQGEDDQDFDEEELNNRSRKSSDSNDSDRTSLSNTKADKIAEPKLIKKEPVANEPKIVELAQTKIQDLPKVGRPAIKQTPKRGANLPLVNNPPQNKVPTRNDQVTESRSTVRLESRDPNMENVTVKEEAETTETSVSTPLFSGQIKTERSSPPPNEAGSTPIIAKVKTESDSSSSTISNSTPNTETFPLMPVTKKEDIGVTAVIEINGDSNDDDDDCCVVSATPAPDLKPIVVPKVETASAYALPPPPSYPSSQSTYNSSVMSPRLSTISSTEKQHSFNWNAPDTKPAINALDRSADDIFESLLSNTTKKENISLSDASEYISLDTLGPQHSCDVCNTRFTDISLLEEHKRMTGHSRSLVAPSSSNLLPYSPSSNILSSLLPVKQLAEQVGKLSAMGNSGAGFTHQQNFMINIQAGNMPSSPYSQYPPAQNVQSGFSQPHSNMYPGQYPNQNYPSQSYGQYQQSMQPPSYPGPMQQNPYSSSTSPYSTASPLQSMQQSVYGQASNQYSQQLGAMGPPMSAPSHPYGSPSAASGSMRPPTSTSSGIKIQNVQTFPPGHIQGAPVGQPGPGMVAPGQTVGGQMAPPPLRMATNANVGGPRPRMPGVRGMRPSIRPGVQVQGQIRGSKPGARMPMKRPGAMGGGPNQKRRSDMLLPGKHDNEDCQVMSMQKQREGLPMIHSVQGAKDKLNIGSGISITKKTVNKEANAMANVLASRGISVKQKQRSRSPSPERPLPHLPNLGSAVSIKHTSKSSSFSIPEATVGGGINSCKICKKMFMNQSSLALHMSAAHPQSKINMFKCDECPAAYPKSLQLQHHKRVFHNVTGPNRELGLPVVDLSSEDTVQRLSNLGIYSFIPLANKEQANGCFGIPVISVHNMQKGMNSSLQALGADGLLSLGPLKLLPN